MARYSGASYRPLGTQAEPRMREYDLFIFHTMVGNLVSTDSMFHDRGYYGTESHFGVGGIWGGDLSKKYDGKVFQWQDTAYSADANLEANPRAISVETADNAPKYVKDIKPWTPKQITALVNLGVWVCRTHKIPPVLIPDSKPSRRGIGYHRLGCQHSDGVGTHSGFLVAGGERWSTSIGKECPGTQRIAQLKTIIVPRIHAIMYPPAPVKEIQPIRVEPSMTILDDYRVTLTTERQVAEMNTNNLPTSRVWKVGDTFSLRDFMLWGGPGDQRVLKRLNTILKQESTNGLTLARIEDMLEKLTPPAVTGDPNGV